MKHGFEYSLLETGESLKKGYSLLLQNAGKAIAALTGFVAVLVTFTEIGFCDFDPKRLTSTALIMLISSYLIYFSLLEEGEKLGRETPEYTKALGEYLKKRELIDGEKIPALRAFCKAYTEEELKFRKELRLNNLGYSFDEYTEYKNGKTADRERTRTFKKIDRIRSVALSPSELLALGKRKSTPELKNPERWRTLKLIMKLIPSSICMLFTISIMLSTKDGLTFADVAEGLLKLSALPVVALRGYWGGYSYSKNEAVFWLETKTRLLDAFLSATSESK